MQRPLSYYLALAKRWIWLVIVGIVICGAGTYIFSKFEVPTYQASAVLVVNAFPSSSDNAQASIAAAPTVAQLVTNPEVLQPVLNVHPGMTLQQLTAMLTVSAPPNTQIVEVDVQNNDPRLAAELANEVSQSFAHYSKTQLPGTLQLLPAQVPTVAVKPKPRQDAAIGALIGLGLAIALIFLFEWIENRAHSSEEVQEVLDAEVLAVIPYFSSRKRHKASAIEESGLVESYRDICANLNAEQARRSFKLIMVTSTQADEGKSKIAANIASFFALTGKTVLLVDANLHRPVQAQQFKLENRNGLSTIFLDQSAQARIVLNGQATSIPTLRVLTAGLLPPNPAEQLQSWLGKQLFSYFRNEAPFDYIVFDTPPILAFADAQIVASQVDATILVADVNKTPRRKLLQVKHILKRTNTRVVGVVINKCRWPEHRKRVSSYYFQNTKQPEVDTSLILYPGPFFPDAARPLDTSRPSLIDESSTGNGFHPGTRSSPFGEQANQNGAYVLNPQAGTGDSDMVER